MNQVPPSIKFEVQQMACSDAENSAACFLKHRQSAPHSQAVCFKLHKEKKDERRKTRR